MKNVNWNFLRWILLALSLSGGGQGAEFVHESPSGFTTAGDVNGDGRSDAVLVDRVSGVVTVGIQQADGSLIFRPPVASGIPEVSSMAMGRFQSADQDTLALTAPLANRVEVISLQAEDLLPFQAQYPLAEPQFLAAFGEGAFDDIAFAGGSMGTKSLGLMANLQNGKFTPTVSSVTSATLSGWNPVTFSRTGTVRLAYFEQAVSAILRVHTLPAGDYSDPLSVSDLRADSRLAYGQFDSAQSDFFIYVPGHEKVDVLSVAANEKSFLPGQTAVFDAPVTQMLRLKGEAEEADQMLILSADGSAGIYDFSRAGGFILEKALDLTGDPGAAQTAVVLADGSFALLTGRGADGGPVAYRLYRRGPEGYFAHSGGTLPRLGQGSAMWGNVFFFNGVPFLEENPRLVGQWSVGDWSSAMIFGATPRADGESFVSSTLGLGSRFTRQFNPKPMGAMGALANQYRDDISLARLDRTPRVLGEVSSGVGISPSGGVFSEAVLVSLTAAQPGASLHVRRTGSVDFEPYGAPFYLFRETTVEAYAKLTTGERTPVTRVVFHFNQPPEKQDADGDGVPDFVEVARNLDPTGGADSDGDGYSDLEELLAGTLLNDPESFPNEERANTAAKLNLAIQPLPWDGGSNHEVYASVGLAVECHEVDGALLGAGTADKPLDQPVAVFSAQPAEAQQRLLVVSTPLHYSLRSDGEGERRGRELIGLIEVPPAVPIEVAYQYQDGTLGTEVQSWITAAQAAYRSASPPLVIKAVGVDETLAFLLMEARLADLLQFRGLGGSTTGFSLTPFREHEYRDPFFPSTVSSAELRSLERAVGDPQFSTAVRLHDLLRHYETVVRNDAMDPAVELLKRLAREVYRVSSQHHDEEPGLLKPPLDVLRQFVRFINLDQEYANRVNLTEAELQQIYPILYPLRFDSPVRSHVTLTLQIPEETPLDGLTYAASVPEGELYVLMDARGRPFELPGHFRVTPGSQFSITAYDDLPSVGGKSALEVLSLSLTTLPLPSSTDADGNLLPDEWELLFFGRMGLNASLSMDGSGYSLLQEFLAGTDPTDAQSSPTGEIATFRFGPVSQERQPDGSFVIEFAWTNTLSGAFEFVVQSSADLVHFSPCDAEIQSLGENRYRAMVPASADPRAYYRVGVRLP
ncbi:hypothetical protein SAMN02745166_04450 [Prosthecobacter debontii]|uniref:FG-GAP repeat-containing protein n=1 Tax=Prosthecobacter debontii TaxID=48467 RepID=A0A1T4YYE0_9BACT|nr:chitobiase/beta-hexosaminidase C-terminal domain-containing protein [Prosthecobacter debontii]SKB06331.1 hypothetical protein SAMN02745166_04450 [Prosthecobacter debontii]